MLGRFFTLQALPLFIGFLQEKVTPFLQI